MQEMYHTGLHVLHGLTYRAINLDLALETWFSVG